MWRLLPLLLLSFPLFGLSLKERFAEAQPGSYVVTAQDKGATFLFVRSNVDRQLIIEEISIPLARKPNEWKAWFQSGAPGHTLWTSSLIDVDSGTLLETFSYTHESWADRSEANAFFGKLLNLSFQEIPSNQRKKVGFPPKHGQQDKRRIWQPRMTVEGSRVANCHFDAYTTRWPNDRSDLSRRKIEVYFPDREPRFFPHWIEVDGKIKTVRMHVIDSGFGAHSPKPRLPLRRPRIAKRPIIGERGLQIEIVNPGYYTSFHLLAESAEDAFSRPHFLKSTYEEGTLRVDPSTLSELDPNQSYYFVISPKEAPECTISTDEPLVVNNFTTAEINS